MAFDEIDAKLSAWGIEGGVHALVLRWREHALALERASLRWEHHFAEFQDSCRLVIQACFALDFEDALSYSGLRQTTRTGSQLRVFPDQRSGWRRRAAS